MKTEFYDRSKRANLYNSIFIYKSISLLLLIIISIVLAVLFHVERPYLTAASDGKTSPFIIAVAVCIILFILSSVLDFVILFRTMSIGTKLNALAFIDHLTGLPNRHSCDLLIKSFSSPQRLKYAGFILMQISNLSSINKEDGHTGGNWLISEFSNILEDVSDNYGYVGRNGGNEFIMLMENCDKERADRFLEKLRERIHGYNEMNVGAMIEVTYSKVLNCDEQRDQISDLISLGYKKIRETPLKLS